MNTRFLCDATCHRLARWLRFLGVDTETTSEFRVYPLVVMAGEMGRILITRNRKFLKHMSDNVFVLKSDFVFEELKEIIKHFGIKNPQLFTRCSKCNAELVSVNKEDVKGKVPYFTYKNFDEFKVCPNCNKIYWKGSHFELIKQRLKKEEVWELLF